jgi:isocitrate dehydrogenase
MKLLLISSRGTKVWPGGMKQTFCVDAWRCRFESETPGKEISKEMAIAQINSVNNAGFDISQTVFLTKFDGEMGYTLAQGQ